MTALAEITDSIRFADIGDFLNQVVLPDRNSGLTDPAEAAALVLAQFYGITEPPPDDFSALANPLRIPNVLEPRADRGEELFGRTAERLRQFGLAFKIFYPASFPEAAQIAASGITSRHPMLTVHPHPILLFGYDYREVDPLWYILRWAPWGEFQLIGQSEWRTLWWLWDENPAATILLEVTGPDSTRKSLPSPKEALENLLTTARTDTTTGVISYMRPVINMIDSLKNASDLPEIRGILEDPTDPLYLRRAEIQRSRLRDFLESLVPLAADSTVKENLRLAVFSAGKAADEFAAAANELYGPRESAAEVDSVSTIEIIDQRWIEHHLEAADHLTEVLRWERQTLGSFQQIIAMKNPFH